MRFIVKSLDRKEANIIITASDIEQAKDIFMRNHSNISPTKDNFILFEMSNIQGYESVVNRYHIGNYTSTDEEWRVGKRKIIKFCSTHNYMIRQGNHLDILFGGYFEQNRCHVMGCQGVVFKTYELKEVE